MNQPGPGAAAPQESGLSQFFSALSPQYDAQILRGCPPYGEMLETLVVTTFLPRQAPWHILELGCGTGNLSVRLLEAFPQAQLTVVDLSEEMLAQTQAKAQAMGRSVTPVVGGFLSVDLPAERFDLVISSLALHHVPDAQKPALYERIVHWLKPGGRFRCADQCLGLPTPVAHDYHTAAWRQWATEAGASPAEIQQWEDHAQAYDHYAPLIRHFQWLAQAGLVQLDCYWRKLFWTVFGGERPSP
jgi:tRNA (cmo5U34)-methyltransferase